MEQQSEYDGCKFLFAYYYSENNSWVIPPYRFLLHKSEIALSGQFISSDWWKLKCKYYSKKLDFVILKVKTDTSIIQLEKDMNSLKNPFPTIHDIPHYVIDYDYYTLDNKTLVRLFEEGAYTGKWWWENNFKLRERDGAGDCILDLKIIYDNINYCLYITTPRFIQTHPKHI